MTGVAPERPDLAIARVLAGGLDDTPEGIARDLAAILDRAAAINTTVIPHPDGEYALYSVEPIDEHGSDYLVRYDAHRRAWRYSA